MNSEGIILRSTDYLPLTNSEAEITEEIYDSNLIKIYQDLVSNAISEYVDDYSPIRTYDDSTERFAMYNSKLWAWINPIAGAAVTPEEGIYWQEVNPAILAHQRNRDTILDEGGVNEISAADIVAGLAAADATTDLGIATKTAETFEITSSTGSNVTIPSATQRYAGAYPATDKAKVDQLSGVNTGDQTLDSLGAEATVNKATDFTVLNDTLFPTVQAVYDFVSAFIKDEPYQILLGDTDTDLVVASDVGFFVIPYDIEVIELRAYARTAPTGDAITLDILADGISILDAGDDYLTIEDGDNSSETSAAIVTIATPELDKNQVVNIECLSVGSSTAGQNVMFTMIARKRTA